MQSQVKTEAVTTLPAEYWETDARIHGALVDNLNPDSLLMLSVRDMPTNTKLNARIYYDNEYELEEIEVVANVVSKDLHMAENWKGYKYRLEFAQISEEDRRKLKDLIDSQPQIEKLSKSSDMIPAQRSATKLSEDFPELPVMVMTGCSDGSLRERASQAGAKEFITKPFNVPDFIARVQRMLLVRESSDELQA